MKLKTFHIITFGCRVNQAESRLIGEKLVRNKFIKFNKLKVKEKSDLVIINTCCVTHRAEKKVRQTIRRVKRENPECFLIVAGCLIDKINNPKIPNNPINLKALSKADLLLTNSQKKNIIKYLKNNLNHLAIQPFSHSAYQDKYSRSNIALVKIQEGCNNFCTYCIVPYVRGRSKSRPADEIIAEINRLVGQGIKEVVLTGIDISSFRIMNNVSSIKYKYKNHLAELIRHILKRTEIKKISFGSINTNAIDDEFINLLRSGNRRLKSATTNSVIAHFPARNATHSVAGGSSRLTNHLHIPLQSGSDSVLKRMKRNYSVKDFDKKISELKKNIPGFTLSTDIIVGFPGETREEFEQTVKTIKKLKKILGKNFTHVHVFRYSPRKGTTASKMLGKKGWEKVPSKEKNRRSRIIRELINNT